MVCSDSVKLENQHAGSADWVIQNNANQGEIEGYAGAVSVNRGGQITFYVTTASPSYTLRIYRLGWYGGVGARAMNSPITVTGQKQPACVVTDKVTHLMECPWAASYTLTVPSDDTGSNVWISGLYIAKLTTTDTLKQHYMTFIVRDDSSHSDLIFNSGANTWQAYNGWGGKGLYTSVSQDGIAALKVSFDRPFLRNDGAGDVFQFEYNAVRFLEKNGYWVTYASDVDLHEGTVTVPNHKAFVSFGHNEYWTREMRNSITTARDAGVNLGFFNGDTMEWQTRLEPSTQTSTPDRVMVEYRDPLLDPYYADPSKWPLVTTEWRHFPVNLPEEYLLGSMYAALVSPNIADYVVQDGSSWVFVGTGLTTGSTIPNSAGWEVDNRHFIDPNQNVEALASATLISQQGTPNAAEMTLYQAKSGAYVLDMGSMLWPWTLDSFSYGDAHPDLSNPLAQQITANILQKFGASTH